VTGAGRRALLAAGLGVVMLAAPPAEAHLFHPGAEPPETQMTRDTWLLQLLLDDPRERFDLARGVWEGTLRVRLKPGGFRRWLLRPEEPGMVFKADYQLHRWSGSLREEAARLDGERGTALAPRIEAALAGRDREGVKAGLREMYALLLEELLESLWQRLDRPDAAGRLYPFVNRYYALNLEGYLNIHRPAEAATARAALDAIGRTVGDSETGAPPSPRTFEQQRRRFLRVLGEALRRP
jgi:hypothetical protein